MRSKGKRILAALWVAGALAGLMAIVVLNTGFPGLSPPSTAYAADEVGIFANAPEGVDPAIVIQDNGISAGVSDAFVVVNETTGAIIDESAVPVDTRGIGWQLIATVTSIGAILVATATIGLIDFTRRRRRHEINTADTDNRMTASTVGDHGDRRTTMQRATEEGRVTLNPSLA